MLSNQQCPSTEETQRLLYERTPTVLCRICLESTGDFIYPCACNGTQAAIHRECLRKWLTYSNSPERCELCNTKWSLSIFSPMEIIRIALISSIPIFTTILTLFFSNCLFDYTKTHMLGIIWYILYTWVIYALANACNKKIKTITLNKLMFTAVWYARMSIAEGNRDEWITIEQSDESYVWDIVFFDIISWLIFFMCYVIIIISV